MAAFANRLALITGAASGIGAAVARHLGRTGARMVLVDRNGDGLEAVSRELEGAVAERLVGDISNEDFWDRNRPSLNGLGLAVVNAGVSGAARITELDYSEWRRILAINLDGAFLTLRAAMRAMDSDGGAIVMTASAAGIKAEPGIAAYGASKAALIHLAKVAAKEGAPRNIRVNAIAPGGVETPVWREMDFFADLVASAGSEKAAFAELAKMATPLGRYAVPEEIAAQIAFLLSDEAATITGTTLTSDGGYTL